MNRDDNTGEISIRQIWDILRRCWLIILAGTLLFASVAFIYCNFFASPEYTAKTRVLIKVSPQSQTQDPTGQQITQTMIQTAQALVPTFIQILKSPTVIDAVRENIPYDYSRGRIQSMITASAVASTAIMEISVECGDAEHAMTIANGILQYGVPEIIRLYGAGSVIELESAELPKSPSSPETFKLTLIAAFAGFALACIICVLVEFFDTKIKTEQDLTDIIDIPVIGVIPNLRSDEPSYSKNKQKAKEAHSDEKANRT